jgi:uncharacterized protein (DUF305 family)
VGSGSVPDVRLYARRLVLIAVAGTIALGSTVAAVTLSGSDPDSAAGPRVVQPGAPGQSGRTLDSGEVTGFAPPTHTRADTLFMHRMIAHHEQALRMTALVAGRGAAADVTRLAARIDVSQRDEIAQMRRWLTDRGEPTTDHFGHDAAMPGMLTEAQLDRLGRARGVEFDRTFLEYMIMHHEGALTMVRELYAAGGGLEPACDRFARDVNADQTIEIGRMRTMLAALGT